MPKPKVFMTRVVPANGFEIIRDFAGVEVWEGEEAMPRGLLLEKVHDVQGLYCLLTEKVDRELLNQAPRLKVISNMAVGVDNIDVSECTARGIPVGNTPAVLTETTADFAFALLMAAARRIVEGADYVRAGQWRTWGPMLLLGQDIHRATLGIIGFGRIGKAMAKRAMGFGMHVIFSHPTPVDLEAESFCQTEQVELDRLLRESDFVSLHASLTKNTSHLIGEPEFNLMKQTAILINTARGSVVDPHALYEALRSGEIAYAALDVTEPEPLPMDSALHTLSNCLIVPHIASASVATRTKMAVIAAQNLVAGLKGEPLQHCVNPEVYQRM